jgi:hypothetical protein
VKITTEPRSDQWNADDFIGGPRDFTIAGVKVGVAEQKYDIELVEGEGRVWRPPVTVLRLLDPEIAFGRDKVGGIRLSHMSDLPDGKPLVERLTATRGKRASHTVQPMPAATPAPAEPTAEEVAACTDVDQLKAMWKRSSPERRQQIEARVADLANEPDAGGSA